MRENYLDFGLPAFSEEEHAKAREIQKNMGGEEVGLHTGILPFEGGRTGLCDTSEFSWNAPYATAGRRKRHIPSTGTEITPCWILSDMK